MSKFERYKKQVDAEKQTEIDDLMTWHKIDKQRIAKRDKRIKELETENHDLKTKNELWKESFKRIDEAHDDAEERAKNYKADNARLLIAALTAEAKLEKIRTMRIPLTVRAVREKLNTILEDK